MPWRSVRSCGPSMRLPPAFIKHVYNVLLGGYSITRLSTEAAPGHLDITNDES